MTEITAEGLSKRYGPVTAVDDVTFRVRPGAVTGFLGANGAGKSTTLRMLLGLVEPSAGRALIGGARYRDLPHPLRRVGAVIDPEGFHPGRSGVAHLRVLANTAGLPAHRVAHALEESGLGDAAARRVGTYSLGMRRRLGLAAALLGDPDVLLLDEPANGLDPEGIRWLRALLRAKADEGRTVLVSSHALAELGTVADEILVIARGRLVAHEPVVPGTDLEARYLELTTQGAVR